MRNILPALIALTLLNSLGGCNYNPGETTGQSQIRTESEEVTPQTGESAIQEAWETGRRDAAAPTQEEITNSEDPRRVINQPTPQFERQSDY